MGVETENVIRPWKFVQGLDITEMQQSLKFAGCIFAILGRVVSQRNPGQMASWGAYLTHQSCC